MIVCNYAVYPIYLIHVYSMRTYEFMQQCLHVDGIRYLHGNSNISRNCMKQLLHISASDDIVINIADKNLGLCINDISWYIQEYFRHISDKNTYQEFPYDDLYYI